MKRNISFLLIITYSLVIFNSSYIYGQQNSMKIIKVQDDKFVANMGSIHGITQNSYYTIIQNNKNIGRAKVVAVREKICALKIINLDIGEMVKPGDFLILDTQGYSDSDVLLDELNSREFSKDQLTYSPQNYYFEGQKAAESEYGGGGAMVGGLACGTLLGLIGWGLGYAIMSASDINVPSRHLSNLNNQQQFEFISGYKKEAKSKRNGKFHAGAAIGTLIAVVIVVSSSSN
ncbi:MAG: hypothetical protein ACOYT8_00865 [Candidatus Dependentiae bacterium]